MNQEESFPHLANVQQQIMSIERTKNRSVFPFDSGKSFEIVAYLLFTD